MGLWGIKYYNQQHIPVQIWLGLLKSFQCWFYKCQNRSCRRVLFSKLAKSQGMEMQSLGTWSFYLAISQVHIYTANPKIKWLSDFMTSQIWIALVLVFCTVGSKLILHGPTLGSDESTHLIPIHAVCREELSRLSYATTLMVALPKLCSWNHICDIFYEGRFALDTSLVVETAAVANCASLLGVKT